MEHSEMVDLVEQAIEAEARSRSRALRRHEVKDASFSKADIVARVVKACPDIDVKRVKRCIETIFMRNEWRYWERTPQEWDAEWKRMLASFPPEMPMTEVLARTGAFVARHKADIERANLLLYRDNLVTRALFPALRDCLKPGKNGKSFAGPPPPDAFTAPSTDGDESTVGERLHRMGVDVCLDLIRMMLVEDGWVGPEEAIEEALQGFRKMLTRMENSTLLDLAEAEAEQEISR